MQSPALLQDICPCLYLNVIQQNCKCLPQSMIMTFLLHSLLQTIYLQKVLSRAHSLFKLPLAKKVSSGEEQKCSIRCSHREEKFAHRRSLSKHVNRQHKELQERQNIACNKCPAMWVYHKQCCTPYMCLHGISYHTVSHTSSLHE